MARLVGPSRVRVVVLDGCFSTRLAEHTGFEIINGAVNIYGGDQAMLLWEQEGASLEPDMVLFVYHVDDYYRNGLSLRDGMPKP